MVLKNIRNMVNTFLGMLLCAGLLLITSCSQQQYKPKTYSFLFIPAMQDPFYYTLEKGLRKRAKELHVTLHVPEYPEEWNPDLQIRILEKQVIKIKPDLVIIAPASPTRLVEPLRKIHDRGIPVITVDTYIGDGNYAKESPYSFPLTYVGTDNIMAGEQIAEHLALLLHEKGKVYCIGPNQGVSSISDRITGFRKGMVKYPDIELVGVDYCDDTADIAYELTIKKLQEHPDIIGIFGINVISAQGICKAVIDTGLTGAVKVTSWDASKELIKSLRMNHADLLLAQHPQEIGEKAVLWGYRHIAEKASVPKKIMSGFDFITKANIDEPYIQNLIYAY